MRQIPQKFNDTPSLKQFPQTAISVSNRSTQYESETDLSINQPIYIYNDHL